MRWEGRIILRFKQFGQIESICCGAYVAQDNVS